MLSSLILSLAMSAAPVEVNITEYNVEEAGTRRDLSLIHISEPTRPY